MSLQIAFTWTPKRKKAYRPKDQLRHDFITIHDSELHNVGTYTLHPEFNQNGNIHWHGIIELKDKIKWYKKTIHRFKQKGFIKVVEITNLQKWIEYITKDNLLMTKVLPIYYQYEHLPIVNSISRQFIIDLKAKEKRFKRKMELNSQQIDKIL